MLFLYFLIVGFIFSIFGFGFLILEIFNSFKRENKLIDFEVNLPNIKITKDAINYLKKEFNCKNNDEILKAIDLHAKDESYILEGFSNSVDEFLSKIKKIIMDNAHKKSIKKFVYYDNELKIGDYITLQNIEDSIKEYDRSKQYNEL